MSGLNSTHIVYGHTGTGKTFTLTGNSQHDGLVQMCVSTLIRRLRNSNSAFSLQMSYLEIYNENIFDLLANGAPRKLRQQDINEFYVDCL